MIDASFIYSFFRYVMQSCFEFYKFYNNGQCKRNDYEHIP